MRIVLLAICCLMSIGCSEAVFYDQHGNNIQLDRLNGDWAVVNYWAEWCEPCREEIPQLNNLHQANQGVQVLGVSFDGAQSAVELDQQIKAMGIEFPVLDRDPADDLGVKRPMALPASWIINPDGKVVEQRLGPQTEAELLQAIALLKAQTQ
ncbi:TlpA family protein disulfide reductase [Aestuariirhabdus sp. Z084]|uniref:TlpA family protein disulfide reductase n=1 Tax=Aestuariirhabdus haliotis TaxID=2918751 RepID=UPI00201B386B|nr:TlpA disulfide reductase family protein [Aestuariirhabdus haliotis]MCL6416306.1 TlpA family protein disulfide reductase [Aestuariirhabdus haliotis]MCL6420179.1 TlpA family protein disulfide reductase [Aestuariirhabdus haliotis]